MAVGTEAKKVGLEHRPGGCEGTGGGNLPPSSNVQEVALRRRMKTRKRGM
jgi:hypothetical protein